MLENNTKIREIEKIKNESVDFLFYFFKKTINSSFNKKQLRLFLNLIF